MFNSVKIVNSSGRPCHGCQNGQTLIMIMLVLLIMLIACLFLVDIQHIIKVKAKTVSAVDSAALVGAEWQRHTLNMIGEINLIKGTTTLITDFAEDVTFAGNPDNYVRIPEASRATLESRLNYYTETIAPQIALFKTAIDNLTQMQVRLSFVGPMLGLGALQQAAKNNGLHRDPYCCATGIDHYNNLLTGNDYASFGTVKGYNWRNAYTAMLYQVLQVSNGTAYGFAVDPYPSYLSHPTIDGFAFLTDEAFYSAVNNKNWCYYTLRQILRNDQLLSGNWWQNISVDMSGMQFPGESEYLTVGISFSSWQGVADRYYKDNVEDGELSIEEAFSSLIDSRQTNQTLTSSLFSDQADPPWSPDDDDDDNEDTDWKFYSLLRQVKWAVYDRSWIDYPNSTISSWNLWLRAPFQDGYTYSGCISYIDDVRVPDSITSHWKKFDSSGSLEDTEDFKETYLSEHLGWADKMNSKNYSTKLENVEKKLKKGAVSMKTSSAAKPLGRLTDSNGAYYTPNTIPVILPVFTHSALIPVSLENPNGDSMRKGYNDAFRRFLVEYLTELSNASSFDDMQEWMDSNGYSEFQGYHNALVSLSDPNWRQEGVEWLDTRIDEDDPDSQTNEDLCTRWRPGGSGPASGPSALH